MTKSEKINLTATVIGPLLICLVMAWASWSFNARMIMEMDSEDKRNAATYVAKTWFESYKDDTNAKLQRISDDVSHVKDDVATIKGELSVKTKN